MKTIFILLLAVTPFLSKAQNVGIGTETPNNSAALEVSSNNKGFLMPRMSTGQRQNIASPAEGLVVYDTDTKNFWFYDGSTWKAMETAGKEKSVYIPGSAFAYNTTSNISKVTLGINMPDNAGIATFIIPRPVDWDNTKPFTVTLHFALPYNTGNTFLIWRLHAESVLINAEAPSANTGWDSYGYNTAEDAPYLVAPASAWYTDLAKSQSWTPKWSHTYGNYYFGDNVTSNNAFTSAPMWKFGFQRGKAVGNGETYSGNVTVTGATINYTSK